MLRKYILRVAVMFMLLAGASYALNAQCTSCTNTTQYGLNEVVTCHKGACGEKGTFSFSRSASLFTTITFQTEGIPFCIDSEDKFHIDFGDGAGFRVCNGQRTFIITYPTPNATTPSANIKTIKIRKGDPLFSSGIISETKFMVKSPSGTYKSPDVVWKVETPTAFDPASLNLGINANAFPANGNKYMTASKGVGHAYIKYSPLSGGQLKKPIIFVDGIDFDSESKNYYDPALGSGQTDANVIRHGVTGWDIFVMGTEDGFSGSVPNALEDFRQYPQVFDNLWAKGYDVIFLDFAEGATWIQKNAEVLKQLLRMVNIEKANNGSSAENVIVGPSMGGQVARIALAEMERDGEKHCTQVYLSFDSPHQGAHIPLGLQAMAWAAYDANFSCDRWVSLNQPAARQLLTYHLANEMGANNVVMQKKLIKAPSSTFFPDLVKQSVDEPMAAAAANGGGVIRQKYEDYLKKIGYPKQTNNLAIADGNINGVGMTAANSAKLFDGNIHITNGGDWMLNVLPQLIPIVGPALNAKLSISPSVKSELGISTQVAVLQGLNVLSLISTYNTLNNLVPNSAKRVMDLKMFALPGMNGADGSLCSNILKA